MYKKKAKKKNGIKKSIRSCKTNARKKAFTFTFIY